MCFIEGKSAVKVLIINVQIGKGSVGQIVNEIYKGIIASGNECKIAYARGDIGDIPQENTIKIGNKLDHYTHALLTRVFGKTATYSAIATKEFIKKMDDFGPDIISIHGVYGYYINMPILFKYIANNDIHLFSTLHSCWDFTGHCCYFDYVNCNQWKHGCKNCIQKKSYPKSSFLENTVFNLNMKRNLYSSIEKSTIITPSHWMEELVKQSILKNIKTITIHNGVDLNVFHPIKSNNISRKPKVLSVASIWETRKGLEDVIELYKYSKGKIDLTIVGLSDDQLELLPKGIKGMKRTSNIVELVNLYSDATVFFNPTYEDNYPTVNLEAIACNTPVITYDTGGCIETINENEYGVVVNKKDYGTILNLIDDIFCGRKIYSFSNIKYVSKEYMVKQYIEIFMECNKS